MKITVRHRNTEVIIEEYKKESENGNTLVKYADQNIKLNETIECIFNEIRKTECLEPENE